ncbi:MAG: iron ABC transporter permease [Thermomicrobiales bacterium]
MTTLIATPTADASQLDRNRLATSARAFGLLLGLAAVVLAALLSIRVGSIDISNRDAWNAIFNYHADSYNETVVRTLRLPRTVIAIAVGGGLAIAGAMMQAVTRNPLAGPDILGVSSGASFAIVSAIYFFGYTSIEQYLWFAFAGAAAASALVFLVGSAGRGGATPIKLALSGVVISSLLGAWTSALTLLDEDTLDQARFWFAGSVSGRPLELFWTVSPFLIGGVLICVLMGHQMNVLSMGEDAARALGMQTARIRIVSSVLVVLITGAAVSVAGPIGFVGLATPHIVRSIVGPDYRWVLPYSVLVGAVFLTLSDVIGRVVTRPGEIQVGIITAIFGAPFLIYLARRRTVSN